MESINNIEPVIEKSGIGKKIVVVIIILVIIAAIFVTYKYMAKESDSDGSWATDGDAADSGDDKTGGGIVEEKPPRPPE